MNEAITPTPYEQLDFSGGFTDNVFSNDPTKCTYNDNLIIDNNKKPNSRPGSILFNSIDPQLPSGLSRVGRYLKYIDERQLFAQNAKSIYFQDLAFWHELTGPTGNPAFISSMDTTNRVSYSEWQGHLFATNDAGGLPIKIYQDASNVWQLRTAGLPAIATADNFVLATATASLVALANDLRTQMLLHFANTGYINIPHKVADTVSAGYVGAACTNLTTCITLTGQLIKAYDYHYKDSLQGISYHQKDQGAQTPAGGLTPAVHSAPSMALESTIAPADIYECASRLNDLHDKYWAHESHLSPHAQNKAAASIGVNLPTVDIVTGVNKGPVANRNYQPLYDWSTQWKATFNLHLADGTGAAFAHSTAADGVNPIAVAVGTTRTTLKQFIFTATLNYENHDLDAELVAGWAYHVAKASSNHFGSVNWLSPVIDGFGALTYDFDETVSFISTLAGLYNAHVQDMTAHFTNDPTYIINQGPGSNFDVAHYVYAIHYSYTYTVGTVTYEDIGPVYEFAADSCLPTTIYPVSITGIPTLTNTADTNYDTSNIVLKLYRTTDGGTTFYLITSLANGTTTYSDNTPDDVLISGEKLYTTGGILTNSPAPVAKYIHIVNGFGYYGNITESDGSERKNRIIQSVSEDIDGCPGSNFDDLEDEVLGISSVRTLPVVFGRTGVYRLEGSFDLYGNGAITHIAINNPDAVGLKSENSIVQIDGGILFAGSDGFYFTDGYNLTKLSGDWNTTYLTLIPTDATASQITGVYDKDLRRVYWGAQRNTSSTDNDAIYCLDLNFGLTTPCWSTWSNPDHFSPTSLVMWNNLLIRGDATGYHFEHSKDHLTDPYINPGLATSDWGTKAIVTDLISIQSSLGMGSVRKWAAWLTCNFKNEGNLTQALYSINDDSHNVQVMNPIKAWTNLLWGDPTVPDFGTPNLLWDYVGSYHFKRRFVAKNLRFTYKKVRMTNALATLKVSATIPGPATLAGTTLTLNDATYAWPASCEGYVVSFAFDDYATSYEILQRVSDTVLYLLDPDGTLVNGSSAWEILGQPKDEKVHVLSYTIHAIPLSTSQQATKSDSIGLP